MTAPEFDFAPLPDEVVDWIGEDDLSFYCGDDGVEWSDARLDAAVGTKPAPVVATLARELRAWRAAGRELVEGNDQPTPAGRLKWEQAAAKLRAIVAHVRGGEE